MSFLGRRCSGCVLVAFLAGAIAIGHAAEPARTEPDFAWWRELDLRDVDGARVASDGRWLVLAFLDPDCPVANAAVPVLNALARGYRHQGVRVIGIYADPVLSVARVREHGREFSIGFPVLADRQQRLVRLSGATYFSEVAVLDGRGVVLYCGRIDNRVGADGATRPQATQHDLASVLDRLVAGETGPFPSQPGFGCFLPAPVRAR